MRPTADRLADILSAVRRISEVAPMLDSASGEMALDAVLYNLVVIGEAVGALPDDLKAGASEVPWRDVVAMRNFLAHQYFAVSPTVIRRTIDEPLAVLAAACRRLLDNGA